MLVFIPLMGVAVYLLLRGVEGAAARVSQVALVLFVLVYGAWEALVGIGSGILVNEINGLPEGERATTAGLVEDYNDNVLIRAFGVLGSIGSLAFITAMIAAGVALRSHADAPRVGSYPAWAIRIPYHRPPAPLRPYRAGAVHRRSAALCAKPVGGLGTRPACTPWLGEPPRILGWRFRPATRSRRLRERSSDDRRVGRALGAASHAKRDPGGWR